MNELIIVMIVIFALLLVLSDPAHSARKAAKHQNIAAIKALEIMRGKE